MKKLTAEEAKKKMVKAIDSGNVEFAHPRAKECFPLEVAADEKGHWDFLYIDATPVEPWKGRHSGGISFRWGVKGVGFGEVYIWLEDGVWRAGSEGMGPDFVTAALLAWAKQIVVQ